MIAWFLRDCFQDKDPLDIWIIIGFELVVEIVIVVLAVSFVIMFIS